MNILLYITSLILCFSCLVTSMSHLETLHALRITAEKEDLTSLKNYYASTHYNRSDISALLTDAVKNNSYQGLKSFLSAIPHLDITYALKEALNTKNKAIISLLFAYDTKCITKGVALAYDNSVLNIINLPFTSYGIVRTKSLLEYFHNNKAFEIANFLLAVGIENMSCIQKYEQYDIEIPFSQQFLLHKCMLFLSIFIARLINKHNQYYKQVIQDISSHPHFNAIIHQVFLYTAPYNYADIEDIVYVYRYCTNKIHILHAFKDMSLIPKYMHSINTYAQRALSSAKWPTDILFIF